MLRALFQVQSSSPSKLYLLNQYTLLCMMKLINVVNQCLFMQMVSKQDQSTGIVYCLQWPNTNNINMSYHKGQMHVQKYKKIQYITRIYYRSQTNLWRLLSAPLVLSVWAGRGGRCVVEDTL